MDSLSLRLAGQGSLHDALGALVDPRKARGCRYRQIAGLITLAAAAVLAGQRTYAAIAQWVEDVSPDLLKALGCIRGKNGRYEVPSEPTLRRAISGVDGVAVDQIIGSWLTTQGVTLKGNSIAIDGKTLRGSHGANRKGKAHLVAALTHREGAVIAQVRTDSKSNEIPAVRDLLSSLPLEGVLVTMDAMHTQKATAAAVVKKTAIT